MAKNEKTPTIIDIKCIMLSTMIGALVYILGCAVFALLIQKAIVPYDLKYLYSKFILLLAALSSCSAAAKGRGEPIVNTISSSIIIFAFSIMLAIIFPEREKDPLGAIMCLFVCILSCVFINVNKKKNSKLHKRSKKSLFDIQRVITRKG